MSILKSVFHFEVYTSKCSNKNNAHMPLYFCRPKEICLLERQRNGLVEETMSRLVKPLPNVCLCLIYWLLIDIIYSYYIRVIMIFCTDFIYLMQVAMLSNHGKPINTLLCANAWIEYQNQFQNPFHSKILKISALFPFLSTSSFH